MWSRNTVRESSYLSFFCGGDPLCALGRRPENTHWGADMFAWVTSRSLSQSKIADLIWSFNSHAEIWTRLFAHVFSVYGWLSELTYFHSFPAICWSSLRTEISVTLSIGNKLYSSPSYFIFLFPMKPICWYYLATALNLLSSSTALHRHLSQYITYTWYSIRRSPCRWGFEEDLVPTK